MEGKLVMVLWWMMKNGLLVSSPNARRNACISEGVSRLGNE